MIANTGQDGERQEMILELLQQMEAGHACSTEGFDTADLHCIRIPRRRMLATKPPARNAC